MIKWNEVTWYSRLGAIILFIGVVPALCFYIGTRYQHQKEVLVINSTIDRFHNEMQDHLRGDGLGQKNIATTTKSAAQISSPEKNLVVAPDPNTMFNFVGSIVEKTSSVVHGSSTKEQYKVTRIFGSPFSETHVSNMPGIENGYAIVNYEVTDSTRLYMQVGKQHRFVAKFNAYTGQYDANFVTSWTAPLEI